MFVVSLASATFTPPTVLSNVTYSYPQSFGETERRAEMKTLIVYASKKGAAREVAEKIGRHFEDAVSCDIKDAGQIQINDFRYVIIGSSVYAGGIDKKIKTFILRNTKALLQKELGLFLCGIQHKEADKVFGQNFKAEILEHAKAKSFLGGIYDPEKAGAFTRWLFKKAAKLTEYTNTIDEAKIDEFVSLFLAKSN